MPTPDACSPAGLDAFNHLDAGHAIATLLGCCSSPSWAQRVVAGRPFDSERALLATATRLLAELPDTDIDDALAGHPRIGDRPDTESSAREQSGVTGAAESVLDELRDRNAAYEKRFGHIYLVFADGRPAEELLAILRRRLANDPPTERRILRDELSKITEARLLRMLATTGAPHEGDQR